MKFYLDVRRNGGGETPYVVRLSRENRYGGIELIDEFGSIEAALCVVSDRGQRVTLQAEPM